jgi:hypothetical protein
MYVMENGEKKKDFFRRFPNLKNIAAEDRSIMDCVNDYVNSELTFDECIETIIVSLNIRVKELQEMFID